MSDNEGEQIEQPEEVEEVEQVEQGEEEQPLESPPPEEETAPEPEPTPPPAVTAPVVSTPKATSTPVTKASSTPVTKTTTTTTKTVSSPASKTSTSPSVPQQNVAGAGVDTSHLSVEKAKATIALIRNPGQNRFGSNPEAYVGTGGAPTPHTQKALPTVGPGQHPWITMGSGGKIASNSTYMGKKKIVVPPPGAWGDGQPGGYKMSK